MRVPLGLECVEEMLQESRLSRWRLYRFHDRFLRDPVDRESQLAIGWTEKECKEWDELAKEDHTYHLTPEEKKRHHGRRQKWPMKLRSDFRAAVLMKNRLHHESGEQ